MRRVWMKSVRSLLLSFVILIAVACGSSSPEIHYYRLAPDQIERADAQGEYILSIDQFVGDSAYEDPRIVYRTGPFSLNYYYYHRWTSPPGIMVSDFLRVAYERTGKFKSVVSGFNPEAPVVLVGRVVAFEEIDQDDDRWYGHVVLDLHLRSVVTGAIVWSATIEESEEVEQNDPEGVARALTTAMGRIVQKTAPTFAKIAGENARKKSAEQEPDSPMMEREDLD